MGEPTKIISNLFIGDKRAAKNKKALQRLGITHVVNVTEPLSGGGVHNFFEGSGAFHYLRVPVQDSDGAEISPHFSRACEFIDGARSQGYGVLVHCQQGVSRSPTITMAYLIRYLNHDLSQAYTVVKTHRSQAKPKKNFLRQLIQWEKDCKKDKDRPKRGRGDEKTDEAGGGKRVKPNSADTPNSVAGDSKETTNSASSSAVPSATESSSVKGPTLPSKGPKTKGPSLPPKAKGSTRPQTKGPSLPPKVKGPTKGPANR